MLNLLFLLGTIFINEVENKINLEFIAESMFVSQQMEVCETTAAQLLHMGIERRRRFGGRPPAETAVIMFFEQRSALLASLHLIAKGAIDAQLEEYLLREVSKDCIAQQSMAC